MGCLQVFLALSLHLGLEGNYNAIHPHVKCTMDNTIIGAYYNSERRISVYAGKEFKVTENSKLELGLVTGYESMLLVPMIRYKLHNVFVAPAYEKSINGDNLGAVVGFEINI